MRKTASLGMAGAQTVGIPEEAEKPKALGTSHWKSTYHGNNAIA